MNSNKKKIFAISIVAVIAVIAITIISITIANKSESSSNMVVVQENQNCVEISEQVEVKDEMSSDRYNMEKQFPLIYDNSENIVSNGTPSSIPGPIIYTLHISERDSIVFNNMDPRLSFDDYRTISGQIPKEERGPNIFPTSATLTLYYDIDMNTVGSIKCNASVVCTDYGENATIFTFNTQYGSYTEVFTIVFTDPENYYPTNVSFYNNNLRLQSYTSETLNVVYEPRNTIKTGGTWTSSDPSVASVDNSGRITANNSGTAVITFTSLNNLSCMCNVEVLPSYPDRVSFERNEYDMQVGNSNTLVPIAYPSNSSMNLRTWISSDQNIVSVNNNGVITAKKKGRATITFITDNNVQCSCTVNVAAPKPTKATFNKSSLTLSVGKSETLTVSYSPEGAESEKNTWRSSDSSVAKVDSNGTVTAVKAGTATITCTTENNIQATCNIKVNDIVPTKISLSKTSSSLKIGETEVLTYTLSPTGAKDSKLTWTSTDSSIAKVDSNGTVTAVKTGTATITCTTSNKLSAKCSYTIKDNLATSVSLNKTTAEIKVNKKVQLTATVSPDNASNKNGTWSSSNSSVATVDSQGMVTAVKVGTATITFKTTNNVSANCKITVKENLAESATIDKTSLDLKVGERYQFTADVLPKDATNRKITWTSTDPTVATIGTGGCAIAQKPGTTTISFTTSNNVGKSCKVTVKENLAESATIDTTSLELKVGERHQFTVDVLPKDATNRKITWTSTDPTVATIGTGGCAIAQKPGTTTISFTTSNNVGKSCKVVVKPVEVESVKFSTSSMEVEVGKDISELSVVITPDNATDKTGTWTTSNSSVVSVDNKGNMKALKCGTATVSFTTYNALKATCKITVVEGEKADVLTNIKITQMVPVGVGATVKLNVERIPSTATSETITITSSNESIAKVDGTNLIGVSEGYAYIVYTSSNGIKKTGAAIVTGEKKDSTEAAKTEDKKEITVALESDGKTLKVVKGEEFTLGYQVSDTKDKLVWTSSLNIVTDNGSGKFRADGLGATSISVKTSTGNTSSVSIVVEPSEQEMSTMRAEYEREVLRLVNVERAKEGLPALTMATDVTDVAQARADECAGQTFISHTRPDGSSWSTSLSMLTTTKKTGAGENLASSSAGYTPEQLVAAWMASPGHRKNIMEPRFKMLGVGSVPPADYYWVDGEYKAGFASQMFIA